MVTADRGANGPAQAPRFRCPRGPNATGAPTRLSCRSRVQVPHDPVVLVMAEHPTDLSVSEASIPVVQAPRGWEEKKAYPEKWI